VLLLPNRHEFAIFEIRLNPVHSVAKNALTTSWVDKAKSNKGDTMGKGCLFGIGIGIGLILVPFIIKFVIFLLALLGIGIASAI
jgi:hypothetical protein